jgi:hypothetical protein
MFETETEIPFHKAHINPVFSSRVGAISSRHLLPCGWRSLEMYFQHKESEILSRAVIILHVMLLITYLLNVAIGMWIRNGLGVS